MSKESFLSLLQSGREFHQITQPPNSEEKKLLQDIFGEEYSSFFEGKKTKTSLVERFFSLVFDSGLRRELQFNEVKENDPERLSKVTMLGRQGFLTELKKRTRKNNKEYQKPFSVFKIDVADVGFANQAIDKLGNNAGDYLLNIIASSLSELVNELSSRHGFNIDPKDLIVGRYGGDEFVIGYIGDLSVDKKTQEMLKTLIKEKIKSRFGYFKRGGKTKRENIRLKNDQVEVITAPDDELEKKLFYSFLNRGIVLTKQELDREKDYIQQSGIDIKSYFKEVLFYNEKYKKMNLQDKISYLNNKHPEFRLIFYLAEKKGTEAQKKLLHFIESYLFDPLLDEMVITRFDLKDHLLRENFKTAYSFELKIKETNDELSYVYSDILITKLWKEKLYPLLRPYLEKGLISLGRFGGTIFILEKDGGLPENVKKKLKKITGISLHYKNKNIHHIVGFAEVDVSKINKDSSKEELDQAINYIFNKPTESYLRRSFQRRLKNRESYDSFKFMLKQLKENPDFKYQGNDYENWLFAKYFFGKRKEERSEKGMQVLETLKQIMPEKKSLIDTIKKLISPQA